MIMIEVHNTEKNMKQITEVDLNELCSKIQEKVNGHYAYLSKFLTQPESMLRRDFEVELSKGYDLIIDPEGVPGIQDNKVTLSVVVPKSAEKGHISDHELDFVSGGIGSHYYRGQGHSNYLVTGHGKHFGKFTGFLRKK